MGVREMMAKVDARIFKSQIVRALASFGSVTGHPGAFFEEPRVIDIGAGDLRHVKLSFECQYQAELCNLVEGDPFTVEGYGCFRFLHELIPGGDESGLTIIVLGERIET